MQRAMTELRHFVFPGLTDEEIADGTAEATVMYLSDSDVWQDGNGPGTNEHQPAANLAFFHRDMAVLITSHVPPLLKCTAWLEEEQEGMRGRLRAGDEDSRGGQKSLGCCCCCCSSNAFVASAAAQLSIE